jgi:hypothetical protein
VDLLEGFATQAELLLMETSESEKPEPLAIAWGADEIGRLIGQSPRSVYHMHEAGLFGSAVKQVGRRLAGNVPALGRLFGFDQ